MSITTNGATTFRALGRGTPVFIYKKSVFRPAAERLGKGLHPLKLAVNSVTTQTAQLPIPLMPPPTLPQHLRHVPTRRLPLNGGGESGGSELRV